MILLYNAGLYLVFVGLYALLNDADIFIGFLWVIDLGVGLIFFIFILHFIPFLNQKATLISPKKKQAISLLMTLSLFCYFYWFAYSKDSTLVSDLNKTWFFNITYIDYYYVYHQNEITELNLLRETYFLVNSFEFFLINFSLFFGLVTSILLCFMIHRIFNFLNYSQIINSKTLLSLDHSFFIRNQNFTSQSNSPIVTRTWSRKKKLGKIFIVYKCLICVYPNI